MWGVTLQFPQHPGLLQGAGQEDLQVCWVLLQSQPGPVAVSCSPPQKGLCLCQHLAVLDNIGALGPLECPTCPAEGGVPHWPQRWHRYGCCELQGMPNARQSGPFSPVPQFQSHISCQLQRPVLPSCGTPFHWCPAGPKTTPRSAFDQLWVGVAEEEAEAPASQFCRPPQHTCPKAAVTHLQNQAVRVRGQES